MARSSTSFKPGNKLGGRRKGEPNKITLDQRSIFDEAISPEDRVLLVRNVMIRALGLNDKDAAPYCKLIFQYIFSLPKVGHEVTVLNMEEIFTTQVKDGVWREIVAEARLRDARRKETPRLEIIEAEVVGQKTKDNGRQKGNGQARNGRKKKAKGRNSKNGPTRKG